MSLHIVGLELENFKKIKVFSLAPKGTGIIKISGSNGAGKTSALDAISLALLGARGGPTAPVRKGAGRGKVSVDLGEFVVTRMWSEGGDTKGEMWIEAKDGRTYPTPQKILDNILGKISFDPLAFSRMEPKKQQEELRRLLGVDAALDELKAKEQVDYQTRRERNNYLTQLEAQRKGINFPEGLPTKKRDIDAMTQELADVAKFNTDIEREKMRREEIMRDLNAQRAAITEKQNRAAALEDEVQRLRKELKDDYEAEKKATQIIAKLPKIADPKDAQEISENIAAARAINQAIDRRGEAEAKDEEIKRVSGEVAKLSRAIDGFRQQQTDIIAGANFPVKGLGFDDNGVIYNELPFEQASNAEQIRVSVAIGMANNPKLRVMRIADGSLLDAESMSMIEGMAADNEFQIWMELVDQTGKVGVYLVDGEIAAIDGVEAPKPKLTAPLGPPRKKAAKTKDSTTPA